MTNQRGRGIGQRDWLADSQQRVRHWLPAPSLSLRRPVVMTRPTLGNVMQRRATKTIEGIPLGPIAGRQEVPLVLRRPIKTSTTAEPMLTLLSPTHFDVDEAVDAAPEMPEVAVEEAPPSIAVSPPALPSRTSTVEPAGGMVTRVFRRLFSNQPPPAPEDNDQPPDYDEPPALESEAPPSVAAPAPAATTPAAEPAAAPPAERHTTLQRSAEPIATARETSPRAAEAPAASPLSLITRLLPRRHDVETAPGGVSEPAASAPETEAAPEPAETPAAEPKVDDVAAPAAPVAATIGEAETGLAPGATVAPSADAPLILRHAPARPDPEAAPEPAEPLAWAETLAPESPRPALAPAVAPVASPPIAAETAPPVVSRSVTPSPGGVVGSPPVAPSLLLRLRRLIRPDAAGTEDAPAEPAASALSADTAVETTLPAPSGAAESISRSVAAHAATLEAPARPREALPASQPSAPLNVRARRQQSSDAVSASEPAAFPSVSTEGASLQLEPWAPVFRARSQPAQTQAESQHSLDPDGASIDPFSSSPAASNGNVTLSAPSASVAAQGVSRAESPGEARQPAGDAATAEDPAKAGAALDQLASQIYERLRRRLVIERERAGGLGSQWQ